MAGADGLTAIQRRLLTALGLVAPAARPAAELVQDVWGDEAPTTARASLANQVARLRRRFGPEVVHTVGDGYALGFPTDVDDLPGLVAAAEARLESGDASSATELAEEVLSRWRGRPFDALVDLPRSEAARQRLEELRRAAENLRLAAALDLGHLATAVAEAERLVALSPTDEHRWSLLVRSLDRSGRRGDALAAYERARRRLADELGLEPGAELRAAQATVLHGAVPPSPTVVPILVGRDDLLADLVAAGRCGRSVLLTGSDGAGKTTVLDALGRRLRRDGVHVARATAPTYPHRVAPVLADLAVELDRDLAPAHDLVSGFLAMLADVPRPLVLLVDDIDRVGDTTMTALIAAAGRDGLAVVATAATTVSDFPGPVVAVPGLDPTAVAELASAALKRPVDPDDPEGRWLLHMSGGQPLLLHHLLEGIGRSGPVDEPPASLRDAVRDLVPPGGALLRALEVLAVCGQEVEQGLVEDLAGSEAIDDALASGLLSGRTGRNGRILLRFRSGAVGRIIVDDLPAGRRVDLHHRIALAYARRGAGATVVAAHALASAEIAPGTAAEWALSAGREASGLGAHADAADWAARAAGAAAAAGPDGEGLRIRSLIAEGDALRLAGDPAHEAVLFTAADAARAAGNTELLADAAFAVLQLGAGTESGALHSRVVGLAEEALARTTDPERRALVAGAASLAYSMTGNGSRCRDLFLQAEAEARKPRDRAAVLPFAYLALGHPSDLAPRAAATDELLELSLALDDPVTRFEALHLAYSVGMQRGDGVRVRDSVAEARTLIERLGDVGRRWSLAYMEAAVLHLDGRYDEAEARSQAGFELFTAISPSRAFAAHGGQLLALRLAQGRLAELVPALEALLVGQPELPAWHAALALAVAGDDPALSAHHARLALDRTDGDFTWLASQVIGGRAAARTGDAELVAGYRASLEPWADLVCWQGTCSYGPVATVLWQLADAAGDRDAAAAHHATARRLSTTLAAPTFLAELAG